ncbi:phage tail tape measure protein [Gimesia fumaroli]|uniref:Phage-related minor tail protein n=1 Tax=Gimesia fumaroli TaxID=2527976 RepID=A0A518ICM4_9PLAN|nr:phage tail tape measure protein [Gimesia fumaroli]QDV50856.1 Phage-related minor tail protein [Gimesia fumaroli]
MNKVETILTAKEAQMLSAWRRSTQSVAAFNEELDKIGRKQSRNKQQSGRFFRGMSSGLAGMVGGYISVAGAAGILMNKNREILTQTEEVGKKFDEIFRKLRVQSGLRGIQGTEAQERVLEIAERQAFTSEQASGASTQLVSSGFTAKEATGGSLEEFLRILNASNITGKEVDPAELAKALASYLQSQGLEKNAENVALVGRKVQALFRGTNLQLPDLTELSKVSSIFKGMLTVEDQLGGMSTLVDQIPAAEAKTGFRNFVLRLSTVTEDQKPKVEALEKLGLQKEDVDFVGESFTDILDRLAVGIEKVPEKDRKGVLNQIFGEKTIAAAEALINDRQKVKDSFPIQNNTKQFLDDVDEATSGRNAASRRAKVRLERRRFKQDQQDDLKKLELEELAEREGLSPLRRDINEKGYNTARYLGIDSDTALNIINPWSWGSVSDAVNDNVDDRSKPASQYGNGNRPPQPARKSRSWWNFDSFDTGNYNTSSYDQGVKDFIGVPKKQQESNDRLTKALEENTAALKQQNEKPAATQKPVQVEVKMTSDTSTAPNGPRASSALARPAK